MSLLNNNFSVLIKCEGIDDTVLKIFDTNVSDIDFSRSAVKITLTEDENASGHDAIEALYDKSLVAPSISQLTGSIIPPKGNVTIELSIKNEDGTTVFTDVTDELFLANHKYSVSTSSSNKLSYEMMFMNPKSIGGMGGMPMLG